MPAPKVRSDFEALKQIAQTFGRQAETNKSAVQKIKQAMEVLQGGDWVGKGAAKFYGEMNSAVLPSQQRLITALTNAQKITTKIGQIMQQAEADATALFKGGANGGGGSASGGGGSSAGGGAGAPEVTPAAGGGGSSGGTGSGKTYIDKAKSVEVLQKAFGKYKTITEGKVEVLSQADFQKAYDKVYGSTEYSWDKYVKPKFGNLEGFAKDGVNYINQDKVSVDTVPHEMLHSNADPKFKTADFGQGNINEGVTEYLTIKAVSAEGYTPSHSYRNEEGVIQELVKVTGEEKLLNAYFKGETDALKTAMESKSKGTWADFKAAMDANDWTKAKALLAPK